MIATINFNLRKRGNGKTYMYLVFTLDKRVSLATGKQINSEDWDKQKARLKKTDSQSIRTQRELNNLYNRVQGILIDNLGINKENFLILYSGGDLMTPFFTYLKQFIENKDSQYTKSGKRVKHDYRQTQVLLNDYCKRYGDLDFDSFDDSFYSRFHDFVIAQEYSLNTFGKHIKNIKAVINKYKRQNPLVGIDTSSLKVVQYSPENVFLNPIELQRLADYQFNARYQLVVDIAIILAWTGVRFEDYVKLTFDIEQNRFFAYTDKTIKPVTIPIHTMANEVLKKHGHLPQIVTNVEFNRVIKLACKLVGINDIVKIPPKETNRVKKYGGTEVEKWKMVSAHTFRRSIATNLFLAKFPESAIMGITGHTKRETLMKYIKLSSADHADMLAQHWGVD